jgi:hypothetical protein
LPSCRPAVLREGDILCRQPRARALPPWLNATHSGCDRVSTSADHTFGCDCVAGRIAGRRGALAETLPG